MTESIHHRGRAHVSWLVLAALSGLLTWADAASAATPATFHVHGRLLTAAGAPAVDGQYDVVLNLYPDAAAQQPVWSEKATLKVADGRFGHALGSVKAVPITLLTGGQTAWLGLQVADEPEASRVALHPTPFALRATMAAGLTCSGCLGLAALKADSDLNLGQKGVTASAVASAAISAVSVAAKGLSGDGAKLTGVTVTPSTCAQGKVVVGVDGAGKVLCAAAGDAVGDALESVSGGLLSTQYAKPIASKTLPKAIADNNPIGTVDEIVVPDLGVAKKLTVSVKLENSNIADLEVLLYGPDNSVITLHKGGVSGKTLDETWPVTAKPASGDINTWIGKNPVGKWRLRVIDGKFFNNGDDGKVLAFSINVLVASNNLVVSNGSVSAAGGFQNQWSAGPPFDCNESAMGRMYFNTLDKRLYYCDGSWRVILPEPLCGNNILNPGEGCDDGNIKDGDGCTSKCVKNVCGDGIVWVDHEQCDDGNVQSGDGCSATCVNEMDPQCKTYKTLNEANRNVGQTGQVICDTGMNGSWYRFLPPAGTMMPTAAVPKYKCSTHAPGWIQGSHPAVKDGIVGRKVCFHWSSNTCQWSSQISVLNCATYYIYKLPKAPVCNLRYCGTN